MPEKHAQKLSARSRKNLSSEGAVGRASAAAISECERIAKKKSSRAAGISDTVLV
jgi:hypothetical protein